MINYSGWVFFQVKYNELVHFIERTGVSLQARFLGYQRKEIKGLFSFFDTLQSALLTNVKRIFVEVSLWHIVFNLSPGERGCNRYKCG